MPRLEVAITILRFVVLVVGLKSGIDFLLGRRGPDRHPGRPGAGAGLWVMIRELGHLPHFRGARLADYKALGHISFYMALIQISVVLADKLDTTILGFMLKPRPGPANAVYNVVSKPFVQLRQTGWMLAYMVMPAVASLAAARDDRGLERVKYDGTRLHIGVLLAGRPPGLDLRRPVPVALDRRPPGLRRGGRGHADAAVPDRGDPPGAVGARADGDRPQQDQGDRAGGPGRVADQPADQLLPDLAARRGGRDLGHRADDVLLEPAGARPLRLPRAGDRPADLSEADLEPAPGRRAALVVVDLAVATADAGHLIRASISGLAHCRCSSTSPSARSPTSPAICSCPSAAATWPSCRPSCAGGEPSRLDRWPILPLNDGRSASRPSYSIDSETAMRRPGRLDSLRGASASHRPPSRGSTMRSMRLDAASLVPSPWPCAACGLVSCVSRPRTPGTARGREGQSDQPVLRQPRPPAEPGGEAKAVTQAILEEIDKHSELMANIEYLCDMIGPRLTGSPGLTKANHWTRDKFRQYGLANAHLEPWTIERAWTRGEAKGRVVVPVEQRILLESAGWSPSTKGPVRGPVVHVKAESTDELTPYKGKLKGAWIVLRRGLGPALAQAAGAASPDAARCARMRDFAQDDAVLRGAQEVPDRRGGRRDAPRLEQGARPGQHDRRHGQLHRGRRSPRRSSPPSPTA